MLNPIKKIKRKHQSGIIAVITVLFIAFLASIILGLAQIILPRLRISAEIKRSVGALYAADSVIEWCLYLPKRNVPPPVMQNNSTYTITPAPQPPVSNCSTPGSPTVKTVGTYQGVSRSLEVSGF